MIRVFPAELHWHSSGVYLHNRVYMCPCHRFFRAHPNAPRITNRFTFSRTRFRVRLLWRFTVWQVQIHVLKRTASMFYIGFDFLFEHVLFEWDFAGSSVFSSTGTRNMFLLLQNRRVAPWRHNTQLIPSINHHRRFSSQGSGVTAVNPRCHHHHH